MLLIYLFIIFFENASKDYKNQQNYYMYFQEICKFSQI